MHSPGAGCCRTAHPALKLPSTNDVILLFADSMTLFRMSLFVACCRHLRLAGSSFQRTRDNAGPLLPYIAGQALLTGCKLKSPLNCCAGSLYHGKLAEREIETELEAGTDAMPLPSTSPESNGPQKYEGAYKGPSKRNSFTNNCATEAGVPMQYRGRLSSF